MFVRFKKALRGDYGRARKGDVREVNADIAKKLVNRRTVARGVAALPLLR